MCMDGACQCPCSFMRGDLDFQRYQKKLLRAANRMAQIQMFPDNEKLPKRRKRKVGA